MTVLEALVDATPVPPSGVDADTLIAAFAEVSARRQAIMDAATSLIVVATDADAALVQLLRARQHAWLEVLAAARDEVQAQRIGTTKLRGYAAGVGA
jgi:hypothetical protein